MTPAVTARRKLRVGSAGIVFAALSAVWYFWISSVLEELARPTGQQAAARNLALYTTLPFVGIAAVAIIVCNVWQSSGTAWAVAIALAFVVAFIYLAILSRAAASFS